MIVLLSDFMSSSRISHDSHDAFLLRLHRARNRGSRAALLSYSAQLWDGMASQAFNDGWVSFHCAKIHLGVADDVHPFVRRI